MQFWSILPIILVNIIWIKGLNWESQEFQRSESLWLRWFPVWVWKWWRIFHISPWIIWRSHQQKPNHDQYGGFLCILHHFSSHLERRKDHGSQKTEKNKVIKNFLSQILTYLFPLLCNMFDLATILILVIKKFSSKSIEIHWTFVWSLSTEWSIPAVIDPSNAFTTSCPGL